MKRLRIGALAGALLAALASGPAAAFWQRSQASHCSDATTDAERARHRCWELDGYLDSGWPTLGATGGYFKGSPAQPAPGWPKGGVTRRLG